MDDLSRTPVRQRPARHPLRRLLPLVLLGVLALAPGTAEARDFNCDASAARIQLGSTATLEPVTANRGATECRDARGPTTVQLAGISVGAFFADTSAPAPDEATARGGLATLAVGLGALAAVPLPTVDAYQSLPAVTVPIPLEGQLLGLPSSIEVDARPAVAALIDGVQAGRLLEVEGSVATARARCVDGRARLSGETATGRLRVLGQELPVNAAAQQAVTLFDGQTINPAALDLSQIVLPPGLSFTDLLVGDILQEAVGNTLASLPAISLPATIVNVRISPSAQQAAEGGLTQHGLRVGLSVLGQNVVDVLVGEARVSVDSVRCTAGSGGVAPVEVINREALGCSSRRLALIDVVDRGRYVSLSGAADRRLAGKRIAIRSRADRRVVARAVVSRAGLFRARAPVPPARYRYTNTARYLAVHGRDRSLNLKLHRRMVFTSIRSRRGRVVLRGLVTKPHTAPRAVITVRQRLTCRRQRVVARVRPGPDGRFRVALRVPRRGDVGVYRATTMVAHEGGGPDFRTYTLPGLVRFAR